MVKYFFIILSTSVGTCLAQAGELTALDTDLTTLAEITEKIYQEEIQRKYQYIQKRLQEATDIYNNFLLLISPIASKNNAFIDLVDFFKSQPTTINSSELKKVQDIIEQQFLLVQATFPESKEEAGFSLIKQLIIIFKELKNQNLWPAQVFPPVKEFIKFIISKLEDIETNIEPL